MFSQLGPLFRTSLREAQATDTRLEIRRDHQNDEQRHKDQDSEDDGGSQLWDDSTSVSVPALRAFLVEFLSARNLPAAHPVAGTSAPQPYAPPALEPASPVAARALRAYAQTSAATAPPLNVPVIPAPALVNASSVPVESLESGQLRAMHRLIGDLDRLATEGVQFLELQRAETFLDALIAAVERASPLSTPAP